MSLSWLHCDRVRLPDGWSSHAAIGLDEAGLIRDIRPKNDGGSHLSGAVIPGMPNLHSHAFQRAMAGLAERASTTHEDFWTWRSVMYRFLARLEPEHVEAIAAQAYLEMVQSGYTSVCEFHYLHNDTAGRPYATDVMAQAHIAAAQTVGIALTLVPVLYRVADFGATEPSPGQRRFIQCPELYLERLGSLLHDAQSVAGLSIAAGFHSLRAVSTEDIAFVLERIGDQIPIHMHIAEQRGEVEACLAYTGRRPVEWLLENLPVSARWALVHATHLTAAERSALAQSGATAVLCPSTEGNLGDGIFPFWEYRSEGGAYGIGTDSHVVLNPAEELRWLDHGQRLSAMRRASSSHAPVHPGAALWLHAAADAARITARQAGQVAIGHHADWVVLDTDAPSLIGRSDDILLDTHVFAARPGAVRDVFVGGQQIVRGGMHAKAAAITARYKDVMEWLMLEETW
jgi:formimidoylglutamate deiminase